MTTANSGRSDRPRTSDLIFEELRADIIAGRLTAGEDLSQVRLAQRFGVSRIPVREAMRQLQREGLVTGRPREQAVVSGLGTDQVIEVIEIRTRVELYLVEQAVKRIGTEAVGRLALLCDEMDDTSDVAVWRDANEQFHELLYDAAGAAIALDIVRQLAARGDRYLPMPVDTDVNQRLIANSEHRGIVDALQTGDRGLARERMEGHLVHRLTRAAELIAGTR